MKYWYILLFATLTLMGCSQETQQAVSEGISATGKTLGAAGAATGNPLLAGAGIVLTSAGWLVSHIGRKKANNEKVDVIHAVGEAFKEADPDAVGVVKKELSKAMDRGTKAVVSKVMNRL